jgi:serine/threonine protein kinase
MEWSACGICSPFSFLSSHSRDQASNFVKYACLLSVLLASFLTQAKVQLTRSIHTLTPRHIVALHEVYETPTKTLMVMELCKGGMLTDVAFKPGGRCV